MNKLSLAIALGTGLALSMAVAPPAHAATVIQSLPTRELSAGRFNELFTPIEGSPALSSPYQFLGAPVSGVIRSQVFQNREDPGLYAYAYQVGVNDVQASDNDVRIRPGGGSETVSEPVQVDSIAWQFNSTPVGTRLLGDDPEAFAYTIADGTIGDLTPIASSALDLQAPSEVTWSPGERIGVLRAEYTDAEEGALPLEAGDDSATLVVMSRDRITEQFVNIQGSTPTTGTFASVYAATDGNIRAVPIPEPATLLAWAGLAGAATLARRVRKARLAS